MKSMQSVVMGYCLACITCSVVREMMPENDSRKVIKAISGLYILLVLLHGAGDAASAGFSLTLPDSSVSSASRQDYEQNVLDRAQTQMEQACAEQLKQVGIHATVSAVLDDTDAKVTVKSFTVHTAAVLSPAQKQQVQQLISGYAPLQIIFESEADVS